jgi:predicted metal-dependent HD superfamily phosphohydrolase
MNTSKMTSNPIDANLSVRFRQTWLKCLPYGKESDINAIAHNLIARYSEPLRRYHSRSHIAHCLNELDQIKDGRFNRDAVEMALWFHDAVYVPGAKDNEHQSAELFARLARDCLEQGFIDKVRALIMLTTHREAQATDPDGRYVVDIDLSSFGISWNEFIEDSRQVRQELSQVADEEYYPAYACFLRSLLDRSQIYLTEHFHGHYEAAARRNIARLLELIATQGSI